MQSINNPANHRNTHNHKVNENVGLFNSLLNFTSTSSFQLGICAELNWDCFKPVWLLLFVMTHTLFCNNVSSPGKSLLSLILVSQGFSCTRYFLCIVKCSNLWSSTHNKGVKQLIFLWYRQAVNATTFTDDALQQAESLQIKSQMSRKAKLDQNWSLETRLRWIRTESRYI